MRVAIPEWHGRVSPVFDVAVNLLLIEVDEGREVRRAHTSLLRKQADARVGEFLGMEADILICGAISAQLESRLAASGVQVIGFTRGMVDEVLDAYLNGELANRVFQMPGCRRRRLEEKKSMPEDMGKGHARNG